MLEQGYNVNEDILDRKMRNMKKSYRTIKDNNKKSSTGRGRVHWEYYDTFEDIFRNDATINHGPTLSSITLPSTSKDQNSVVNAIPTSNENSALATSKDKNFISSTSVEQTMSFKNNLYIDKVTFYYFHCVSFRNQ